MKIYTKTGDAGKTTLVDGSKIEKSNIRLNTYGTIDELNSHIGVLVSFLKSDQQNEKPFLMAVQNELFNLGSQLACKDDDTRKKLPNISEESITKLEGEIDRMTESLPPLKNFILPGGGPAGAQAHICRTVCRRAERSCVLLNNSEPLDIPALKYLNRMSDYFFILSRYLNHLENVETPEWTP